MRRVALTIVYNGYHHLKHNSFAMNMINNFDLWIIVEGAASNNGSTSWCNKIFLPYCSQDGTMEYLSHLKDLYPDKIILLNSIASAWDSKDQMINHGIDCLKNKMDNCFLWQVDVDEQWDQLQLTNSENELKEKKGKTGMFLCDYYVSDDLFARGDWGEGKMLPYRRLWLWEGERFLSHEPPRLYPNNGKEILLSERFRHYAYMFEKDVYFKSLYYGGHENIYPQWLKLQIKKERDKIKFPLHISFMFGNNSYISKTKTYIEP